MADDLTERSAELGKKIEAAKRANETPTPKEVHDAAAARHSAENGTGLNSGKA